MNEAHEVCNTTRSLSSHFGRRLKASKYLHPRPFSVLALNKHEKLIEFRFLFSTFQDNNAVSGHHRFGGF